MMSWQFQADQPIYTQLVARLQQQLVSGVYPPGSKLPSVRELAADAGVNPNTCLLYTSDAADEL